MSALAVLATVDRFLAKVYGPRQPKAPPMVACSGLDQRLDVVIDELRGLREATERLVELQAENLRLKVAGPSIEIGPSRERVLTAGRDPLPDNKAGEQPETVEIENAAALRERLKAVLETGKPVEDDGEDGEDDQPGIAGRVGRAIKRKVKG